MDIQLLVLCLMVIAFLIVIGVRLIKRKVTNTKTVQQLPKIRWLFPTILFFLGLSIGIFAGELNLGELNNPRSSIAIDAEEFVEMMTNNVNHTAGVFSSKKFVRDTFTLTEYSPSVLRTDYHLMKRKGENIYTGERLETAALTSNDRSFSYFVASKDNYDDFFRYLVEIESTMLPSGLKYQDYILQKEFPAYQYKNTVFEKRSFNVDWDMWQIKIFPKDSLEKVID